MTRPPSRSMTAPGESVPPDPAPDRAFVMIAGGGTGGHVYPAIAVADELVRRGRDLDEVRFLGSARGLEATAVPAAGYGIDLLPGRGFRRSLTPAAIVQNLRTVWDTAVAITRAVAVLRSRRPRVVFGVGGYAAAPGVLAARCLRIRPSSTSRTPRRAW